MTDKDKIELLDEKLNNVNGLLKSERAMNEHLKKHIINLEFQIETQSSLIEKLLERISDLKMKLIKLFR